MQKSRFLCWLLAPLARRKSSEDTVLGRLGADYHEQPGALHEDEPLPEEEDWECPERDAELIYGARHVNEGEAPGESA